MGTAIECLTTENDLRQWCMIISAKGEWCKSICVSANESEGVTIDNLIFDDDETESLIEILQSALERRRTTRAEAVEHEREYRGWCAPKDYVPTYGDESKPESR